MKAALRVGSLKAALTLGISLLATACTTAPAQQTASANSAADGKVAQVEKQVCRSEKRTGTNFPKRICKSAEQWAEIDNKQHGDAYDYTRQVFENGSVTGAKNCGQSGQMASC